MTDKIDRRKQVRLLEEEISNFQEQIKQLTAERDKLSAALDEWLTKTDFLQDDPKPQWLGMHRVDVLIAERDSALAVLREAKTSIGACQILTNSSDHNSRKVIRILDKVTATINKVLG